MRIAICDNESIAGHALHQKINSVSTNNSIHIFTSILHFWNAIEDGETFHLVFMDIDWNQAETGIDFAEKLFDICPKTQIIYVTGYNDRFSQQIFLQPTNLCGYLVKPVKDTLLLSLLQKAESILRKQTEDKLMVQQKGILYAVAFHEIIFLESNGHQVRIHTKDRLFNCYERLETIKRRLSCVFLQCHKSYLVNMDYIQHIEKGGILMTTGVVVPVSKSQYANTRSVFFRYMGQML